MARPDAFFFSNGQHADDERQLRAVLKLAPLEVTGRHIGPGRNDYVPWIRNILGDETLARKVEKCRSVEQVTAVLDEHLDGPQPRPQGRPQIPERTAPAHPQPHSAYEPVPREEPAQHAPHGLHEHKLHIPEWAHKDHHPHASKDFLIGFGLGVVLALIIYATLQALL